MVENCRRQGIAPLAYMRGVFENIGDMSDQNTGEWTPVGSASGNGVVGAVKKSL